MILVDSSVWIDQLRGFDTEPVRRLRAAAGRETLLVGDLILVEVLQGARDDGHAARLERNLRRFPVMPLLADDLVVAAARNYRVLRSLGVTVRKTIDVIIGTWCIVHGHALLHDDRDFAPMERHLGLRVA